MEFSSRASQVTAAAGTSWELSDRAARMAADGEDVILLTVGDVDRATPDAVVEGMIASVRSGRTHYGPIAGEPRLRSAVARSCSARIGRPVSHEQVVIFPGAQCALFSVMQCLAGPGDEVVLLEPSYATYESVVAASGADFVRVSLRSDAGFHLDVERIASAITPRCRAVLVNSPNNPCGAVFTESSLSKLVAVCAARGVWLISDEVYGRLTFDAPHISPASLPAAQDCVVVIDSLSKSHAMTGWRIGWAMGPQALASHLINFAQAQLFSSPPFIQDAAVIALEFESAATEALRATYLHRRDVLIEGLRRCPELQPIVPQGGMFVLVDVSGTGLNASRFAEELLARERVAVIAGDAFGVSVADMIRVGLTQPQLRIREACDRICRFVAGLDKSDRGANAGR